MLLPVDAIEHPNSSAGSLSVPPEKNVLIVNHLGYFSCDDGLLQCEDRTVALFQGHTYKHVFHRLWTRTVLFGDLVTLSQFALKLCGDLLYVQMLCKNTMALSIWNVLRTTKGLDSDAFLSMNMFHYLHHFFVFFGCDRRLECSAWVLVGSKKIRRDWNCEWGRSSTDHHFSFKV